jgi:hypothetical protein
MIRRKVQVRKIECEKWHKLEWMCGKLGVGEKEKPYVGKTSIRGSYVLILVFFPRLSALVCISQ